MSVELGPILWVVTLFFGQLFGHADRFAEQSIKFRFKGANRNVTTVRALERAIEGSSSVEDVCFTILRPFAQRGFLVDRGHERDGPIAHRAVDDLANSIYACLDKGG